MPEFAIRAGTDNPGFDYEKEVAALLAIRYAFENSVEDFWIAVNSNNVGDTDDVVLCITPTKGEKYALLIQLKHEEPTGNVKYFEETHFTYTIKDGKRFQSKEKFSVDKYCRGYKQFQSNLNNFEEEQPEIIQHLREVNQFSYILYTNKGLTKKLSCLVDVARSECRNECINLNLLKTSESPIYKFKSEDFKTLRSFDEDFLQNFYLFPNQTNIKRVVKLIKAEIKRFFGSHKFDYVTRKYLEIIKLWTKGCEFPNGIKYNTLSKRDVINILTDILLDKYKVNIEEKRFSCYDCPQKKIWNKLVLLNDISIVQTDRLTRRFLRDYIGTEIKSKTKKHGEYWKSELDRLASKVFLDQIPNERIQMLKLCCPNNNNSITVASVYKFMWFYEDLPLLLVIPDQKAYNDILQILKISKYRLKVIGITENEQNLTYQKNNVKHFSSFNDLVPTEKDELLKLTVQFQGRCPVLLSDITGDRMYPHLKCADIIHILSNDFNVGNKFSFNYDKEGHIKRKISKILISFEALVEIKNEFFLIETRNEREKTIMVQKLATLDKNDPEIAKFELEECQQICVLHTDKIPEKIKELQTRNKCFHRLLFHEIFLEWRESTESVTNISKFRVISQEYDNVFNFLKNLDTNKLQVISAHTGMGKSALINYISYYSTCYVWIIPVLLNDLVKHKELKEKFLQFKETEFFEFYASHVLCTDSTVQNLHFSLMVFEDMVKSKKLLILLDGFDEISILHKNTFSKLFRFLQTEKYSSVVTTREHMTSFLESEFNVLSRNLKAFTLEEQKYFLTHYFKSKLCDENVSVENPNLYATLLDFVEKVSNAAQRSLENRDDHFTEIPLHLELMAKYFLKDCESLLSKEKLSLSTNFNLLEQLVADKNGILCSKYGENEGTWTKSLEDDQYLFALEYLFEKEYLLDLKIANSLRKYYQVKKSSSQFIQRGGILIARPLQDKMSIDFIHRTFAEYLAAKWLTENIKNSEVKPTITTILRLRFEKTEYYQVLFSMFDRILVKGCKFHSNIINVKVKDLKSQLVANPRLWLETDKMNRTAFHLLSVYAKNFAIEDLVEILYTTSLKNVKLNTSDDFGYTVQDYAFISDSWTLISIFCKLCPNFMRPGYYGLQKYCILKKFLGLMEFQNRWFVLKRVNEKNDEVFMNSRVIRPVDLIIRVLSQFVSMARNFEIEEKYYNYDSHCRSHDLKNLSAENLVLVETEYQFIRRENECNSINLFHRLQEAESALNTANDSGSKAFLEIYHGDLHKKNSTTSGVDIGNNSIPKMSYDLVQAYWILTRRTRSQLKRQLEINFYINNYYIS